MMKKNRTHLKMQKKITQIMMIKPKQRDGITILAISFGDEAVEHVYIGLLLDSNQDYKT